MNQQRLRIVICDTDPETLIHLEQMLEDAGFDTASTWNAADLEQWLEQRPFHLLIIGHHPPQMDAELMLGKLRGKQRQVPHVLCLIGKQYLDASNAERLRSAGATAVLSRRDYGPIVERAKFYLHGANAELLKVG